MQLVRRALVLFLVVGLGSVVAAWFLAGREAGPAIEIKTPDKFIGQAGSLEMFVDAPGGALTRLTATVSQNGQDMPVFSLDDAQGAAGDVKQASSDRLWVIRPLGKKSQPALVAGTATLTVTAARPVLFGLRQAVSSVTGT